MTEVPSVHPRANEAAELFVFLRELQRLKSKSPTELAQYVSDGGYALALSQLPSHPAVRLALANDTTPAESPILVVDRLPPAPPPALPASLGGRVHANIHDSAASPTLDLTVLRQRVREAKDRQDAAGETAVVTEIADCERAFERWHSAWLAWAEADRRDRPTRELYRSLAAAWELAFNASQEWEFLLGIGRVRWRAKRVDRCAVVWPVRATIDDRTGSIVIATDGGPSVEEDVLPGDDVDDFQAFDTLRGAVADAELSHPLARDVFGHVLRTFAFRSVLEGQFQDEGEPGIEGGKDAPLTSYDPVLFVRKRSRSASLRALDDIARQLREAPSLSDGILALVDPDLVAPAAASAHSFDGERDGAAFQFDDEVFLALPVNERQRRIVLRTEHRPLTLVQGPPGTGKTHTTAALVSHMLAKGLRILITADAEQALREVQDKLPADVRELSVAVLGAGTAEMDQLKKSVSRLDQEASDHDAHANAAEQERVLASISTLRVRLATKREQLRDVIEAETRVHTTPAGSGTFAQLIERLQSWPDPLNGLLAGRATFSANQPAADRIVELLIAARALDGAVHDAIPGPLPDRSALPDPQWLAQTVASIELASQAVARMTDAVRFDLLVSRSDDELVSLDDLVAQARVHWVDLEARSESWITEDLRDITARQTAVWTTRLDALRKAEAAARTHNVAAGAGVDVPAQGERTHLRRMAVELRSYVDRGEEIKLDRSGQVKFGMFTASEVKGASDLLTSVRVDGRPPVTTSALDRVRERIDADAALSELRSLVPDSARLSSTSFELALADAGDQIRSLGRVRDFMFLASSIDAELERLGVPRVEPGRAGWNALDVTIDAAKAARFRSRRMSEIDTSLGALGSLTSASALVGAAQGLDPAAFREEHERLGRAIDHAEAQRRLDAGAGSLRAVVPELVDAILRDPTSSRWNSVDRQYADGWNREALAAFLSGRSIEDPGDLLDQARQIEDEIQRQIGRLAALRAWSKAVSRLSNTRRAYLQTYVQLVKSLGKGTGKLADQKRVGIRRALENCRDSVPVWIMPLYRVASTLPMEANSFDVVIIDEASQAGLDALLLQYLSPKLVVVGDDKQVSPSAVGIDRSAISLLAEKHLPTSPFRDVYKDPTRSFFDEARTRYGDIITLTEHRRCVPDIIGFSNEIAYEPEGIRLVPIREPGASALDPVVPLRVIGAAMEGSGSSVRNVREAEVLVDRLVECLEDHRYDGMTFGVIVMLGSGQVKVIDQMLRDRVDPKTWRDRELRVGQPPDFQGSERDVIFLSMVAATDDERRLAALTSQQYVQRYNVATSRAKDQMWVVHSIDPTELRNPEDMRRRLLDYVYRVHGTRGAGYPGVIGREVSESEPVAPFDSRFEQRVHNELVRRGYSVVPQYQSAGYSIDLVVVGERGKLAIECDGDHWHTSARSIASDLARQRDLERCGWTFVRIRESDFVENRERSMARVRAALDAASIYPRGATATPSSTMTIPETIDDESAIPMAEPSLSSSPPEASITPDTAFDEAGRTGELVRGVEAPGFANSAVAIVPSAEVVEIRDPTIAAIEEARPPAIEDVRASPIGAPRSTTDQELASSPIATFGTASGNVSAGIEPYLAWPARPMTDVAIGSRGDIAEELCEIAEFEAPLTALRLFQLHRKASGGARVGKGIKLSYSEALRHAVSKGLLNTDGDFDDLELLTVVLPDSPRVRVRSLGDRDFWEVPRAEVVALVERLDSGESAEVLARRVASFYEIGRFTTQIEDYLRSCVAAARGVSAMAAPQQASLAPESVAEEVPTGPRVVPEAVRLYVERLVHPVRRAYGTSVLAAWEAGDLPPTPVDDNERLVAERLRRLGIAE